MTHLPGPSFSPSATSAALEYDSKGNLLLPPGDHTIPVMTFCMEHEGESPDGSIYSLSRTEGTRAKIVRELNLKALPKYSPQDIQIVSWSLQAGLAYEEMTDFSQRIIDDIIPEFKPALRESFLAATARQWDQLSESSGGILPSFESSSDELIGELGEVGKKISGIRKFKSHLDEVGHNFAELSQLIEIKPNLNQKSPKPTPWSKVSNNVYARFVTDGHFLQIGYLQIRVLSQPAKRQTSSTDNRVPVDILSWIADSMSESVQPLSFSALYGYGGVLVIPALAEAPVAATLILAAILTSKTVDWNAFEELHKILKDTKNPQIQKYLNDGNHVLQEKHDDLEKPLREAGIISGKTKNTSTKEKNKVREYEKSGDDSTLEKDFEKLPGEKTITADGTEIKTLPDGTTAVKRPRTQKRSPTLELQPPNDEGPQSPLRIKVRYR